MLSFLAQAACCWFRRSFLWLLFGRYLHRISPGSSAVLTGLVVFLSQISGQFLNIGHHRFTPGTLKSTNYPTFNRRILQRPKMNHIIIIIIITSHCRTRGNVAGHAPLVLYLLHFSVGVTRHDGVVPLGVPAFARAVQQQWHKSPSLLNGLRLFRAL